MIAPLADARGTGGAGSLPQEVTMQPFDLVLPLFVQVMLTLFLLVRLGRTRAGLVRSGQVKIADIALGQDVWPESVKKVANSYRNQMEVPVLFYALVAVVLALGRVDLVLVVLSWIFVLSRIWHARIHITHNNVARRFRAFLIGVLIIAVAWIYLVAQLGLARFGLTI